MSVQENIIITRIFLVVLGLYGLVPLHSYSKFRLVKKKYQLLLTILLIVSAIGCKAYFITKDQLRRKNYIFSELFEFLLSELTWIFAIIGSYRSRLLWYNLIKKLVRCSKINNNYFKWDIRQFFKCPAFYVLIICICTHVASVIVTTNIRSKTNLQITVFVKNLICLRIAFLVYFLTGRFKILTQKLHKIIEAPQEAAIETIASIRNSYLDVDDLVQNFNDLNGHQLLLVMTFSSLQLMNTILSCIEYFRSSSESNTYIFIMERLLSYWGTTFSLFYMMNCCDAVGQASDELLKMCSDVDKHFSIYSKLFQELKYFSKLIYYHRTKISASGYFELNRLTIFYFLYNTSVYFVVLVQFYDDKRK